MTVNERWNIAKEQKLCFRCLSDGHRGEACRWKIKVTINIRKFTNVEY